MSGAFPRHSRRHPSESWGLPLQARDIGHKTPAFAAVTMEVKP